ncbi:MAG: TIGR04283 family arsenosugar biosynthesis glycosyltransferase [Phaeodactylibacter sp.]|nr:TIGR04283 family arsenosugar biosynthesis glycosyltransferase [Phaeodactylibacter sp.]
MAAQDRHSDRSGKIQLSVIIPTLNEENCIASMLAELLSRDPDLEIIVVDGGSTDGTLAIVRTFPEVCLLQATAVGRALQYNAGARVAGRNLLFFLHADSRLPEGAFRAIRDLFEDPKITAASFYLRFDRSRLLYRVLSLLSRLNHTLATYGDQGLVVRQRDFQAVGGFPEIPICEDLAIQQLLRKRGKFRKIPLAITTAARRFEQAGPWRQTLKNTVIVLGFLLGVAPQKLKRWYPPFNAKV